MNSKTPSKKYEEAAHALFALTCRRLGLTLDQTAASMSCLSTDSMVEVIKWILSIIKKKDYYIDRNMLLTKICELI